ncbi:MAG: nucleotidyltransferase family protein [Ruminococcus sp.]|jgi:molybdenum cofactor cytidylyltransferase
MKTRDQDYTVLIVAAGCSRRMKKFKPLLPLGDGCILQSTISNFQKAGLKNILVVVGYKRHEVIPLLKKMNVRYVINRDYDETDMLESVKLGLKEIKDGAFGILLCPGDVPLILPETIKRAAEVFRKEKPRILIPTYHGKPGHPPVFSGEMIGEIIRHEGEKGLRGVFEEYESRKEVRYLEVDDEEILQDTDLPEDYERLLQAYEQRKKGGSH